MKTTLFTIGLILKVTPCPAKAQQLLRGIASRMARSRTGIMQIETRTLSLIRMFPDEEMLSILSVSFQSS